ncbi:PREDICTED: protein CREG2 [Mandrillus leucophaeus]|uniref:protein CREG2 n=1 Tax=Mandrillus leucophaeus TaxID=9568 RepID=UPI0005F4EB84|nr:PREDICTED: protein CREG2 [Mandrillus leucophaeus]
MMDTNSSRDLVREEDSAGCAACAWNLVFCEPGLLSEARGCRDSPGLAAMQGLPFGSCLPISDGPFNNSTGIPFFYMTAKDPVVADLMKNPTASLMLPESEGEFCRKNIVDPEDPRCVRLTLTGQMIAVSPEEVEFAKQAMFSRHPGMRKWPRQYEWFFMKMRIEHIWLLKWYGGVSNISKEEYFKAVPRKA